jgi:hypothetical protein
MLSDFGRRYLPPNCPGFTAVGEEFGDMMEEEEEEGAYTSRGRRKSARAADAMQERRSSGLARLWVWV